MRTEELRQMARDMTLAVAVAALIALILLAAGCSDVQAPSAPEGAPAAGVEPAEPSPRDPRSIVYDEWSTTEPGQHLGYNARANLLQRGKRVYDTYCVGCHGENGDGQGPAAVRLLTKPRDFTRGIYKFRSTDSSSLPLETDLHRTITNGLGGGVSMPGFPFMAEPDKLTVIEYIKAFYPDWDEAKAERVVLALPVAPSDILSPRRVRRGRIVFVSMQCWSCHGVGVGPSAVEATVFTDAWGNPQKAFDFTQGSLKGGDSPEDIYRTFSAGLRSIMPAFPSVTLAGITASTFRSPQQTRVLAAGELEALAPDLEQFPEDGAAFAALDADERAEIAERNSWDLVAYVLSLRTNTTTARAVLGRETP